MKLLLLPLTADSLSLHRHDMEHEIYLSAILMVPTKDASPKGVIIGPLLGRLLNLKASEARARGMYASALRSRRGSSSLLDNYLEVIP